MKSLAITKTLFSVILLVLLLAPMPLRAEEETVKGPADTPPSASVEQPANPTGEQSAKEMQTLRQRYGHDPTGVRARIGMCRRGHGGGHGNGRGGGYGRGRGAMHEPRHPCPVQDRTGKKP